MVHWAAQACGVTEIAHRIASAPRTPEEVACETAREMWPGHDWAWYRAEVRRINWQGANDAPERVVLRRYREALSHFKAFGRVQ